MSTKRLTAKQRARRRHLHINIAVASLTAATLITAFYLIRYDHWLLFTLCLGSMLAGCALTLLIPQLIRRGHDKTPRLKPQPVIVDAAQLNKWADDEARKVTYAGDGT